MCHFTNYSKTSVCRHRDCHSHSTSCILHLIPQAILDPSCPVLHSVVRMRLQVSRLNLHVIHTVFKTNSSKEKSVFSCGLIIDEIVKCFLFVCLRRDERFNRPCSCVIAAKIKKNIKGQKKASEIMLYSLWFKTNLTEASRYQKLSRLSRPLNHLFCV